LAVVALAGGAALAGPAFAGGVFAEGVFVEGGAAVAVAVTPPPDGRALDPRRFAPGSCVAFKPTAAAPRRRQTVFIDAGHGGPDPGGVGVTLAGRRVGEATENLKVALDALAPLRAAGYRVVLDRTTASAVALPAPGDVAGGIYTAQGVHRDLIARDVCANLARAAILIGVYLNAGDPSLAGGLTLYDADRPFAARSRRLAELVQHYVLAALRSGGWEVPDDGVHDDSGYGSLETSADRAYGHLLILGPPKPGYLTTPSRMPGALTEPLFITNPQEASIADSSAGQRAIARGLVAAAERYLAPHATTKDRRAGRRAPDPFASARAKKV
jgi:N-acetylmuramoyl-L-alanine amidase